MTASEPPIDPSGGNRSLADWALDLFVYLPAGVVATALDDMDEMAEKGRARVDQQLRNAHVIGRFAVDFGLRRLKRDAEAFLSSRPSRPSAPGSAAPPAATTTAPAGPARSSRASSRPNPASRTTPASRSTPSRDPEVDRAIPDYDALSASQVVRRLDGLEGHELRAILRHERATRARRTILHRTEQLLGTGPTDAPGTAPAP